MQESGPVIAVMSTLDTMNGYRAHLARYEISPP